MSLPRWWSSVDRVNASGDGQSPPARRAEDLWTCLWTYEHPCAFAEIASDPCRAGMADSELEVVVM
jgi:hypothetical protein